MKLNCDLGESFGAWKMGLDEHVMPHIDMANIACGFHAGDPDVMAKTLALASQYQLTIGAHPSYQDLQGFGRRSMRYGSDQIINLIVYQTAALSGMAATMGLDISYVKPHGALYNDMMADDNVRHAVYQAIARLNRGRPAPLKLMILATNEAQKHRQEAEQYQVSLLLEAFADRRYTDQGQLQPRTESGSVLNEEQMLAQVAQLVRDGTVTTATGNVLLLQADTLCVHGDNADAIKGVEQIRAICQK